VIAITTGRRPTKRINSFARDLAHSIPKTILVRRGKLGVEALAAHLQGQGVKKLITIYRWKGGPGLLRFEDVLSGRLQPFPLLLKLKGVKLRREYPTLRSGLAEAIVFEDKSNQMVKSLAEKLSKFLSLPLRPSGRGAEFLLRLSAQGSLVKVALVDSINSEIGPSFIAWETKPRDGAD